MGGRRRVCDQFIQFTEGVIAREELGLPERVVTISVAELLTTDVVNVMRIDDLTDAVVAAEWQ